MAVRGYRIKLDLFEEAYNILAVEKNYNVKLDRLRDVHNPLEQFSISQKPSLKA